MIPVLAVVICGYILVQMADVALTDEKDRLVRFAAAAMVIVALCGALYILKLSQQADAAMQGLLRY